MTLTVATADGPTDLPTTGPRAAYPARHVADRARRRRRGRGVDRRPVVLGAGGSPAGRARAAVLPAGRADRPGSGGRARLAFPPGRRSSAGACRGRRRSAMSRPLPEVSRRWMTVALVALLLAAVLVAVLR